MKARERIKRIRNYGSLQELELLAKDELPGTKFDFERLRLISQLEQIKAGRKRDPKHDPRHFLYSYGARLLPESYAKHYLQVFGEDMAQAIADGNSDFFREWADTIDAWKNHKPFELDKLRLALVEICVPECWFNKHPRRWINSKLKTRGFDPDNDSVYRQVTRVLHDLKIKTDGKTGRKQADTKPRKSRR